MKYFNNLKIKRLSASRLSWVIDLETPIGSRDVKFHQIASRDMK